MDAPVFNNQITNTFNMTYLHAPTIALPTYHPPLTCLSPCRSPRPRTTPTCDWWWRQHPVDICQWGANTNEQTDKVGKMGVGDNGQGKLLPPTPHLLTSHAAVFTWLAHPLARAHTEPGKGEV